jgi:hypothetical protein
METELESQIKKTSIIGRLAFGSTCIEQFVAENKIENKWVDRLVQTLWEFTSSTRLDEWDEKIADLTPENILDTKPGNVYEDYPSLSKSDFIELKQVYLGLPEGFIAMIDNTIEVGVGNLYSGTGEYSDCTLKSTIKVHENAARLLSEVPSFSLFMLSGFHENHGWGHPVRRERFGVGH